MDDEKEAEIRYRAYELWEQAGRPPGQHFTYWLAAEKEHLDRPAMAKNDAATAAPIDDENGGYDSGIPDRF